MALVYNATVPLIPGHVYTAAELTCPLSDNLYVSLSGDIVNRSTGQVCVTPWDFVEATEQLADIFLAGPRPPLANALADSAEAYLSRGRSTVFLPHSQGNLFANQALSRLASDGRLPTSTDSLCVGAIPVASPTAANWTIASPFLQPVQLDGDIILSATPPPHFDASPSLRYGALNAELDATFPTVSVSGVSLLPFTGLLRWFGRIVIGFKMHNFDTYMAQDGGGGLMQDAVSSVADACSATISVPDGDQYLQVGDSAALHVAVATAAGASRALGTVSYSSSDASVATVDENGIVRGVSVGQVVVTAASAGAIAQVNVRIDDANAGVSPPELSVVSRDSSASLFFSPGIGYIDWKIRVVTVDVAPPDSLTQVSVEGVDVNVHSYGAALGMEGLLGGSNNLHWVFAAHHSPTQGGNRLHVNSVHANWEFDPWVLVRVRTLKDGVYHTWHLSVSTP